MDQFEAMLWGVYQKYDISSSPSTFFYKLGRKSKINLHKTIRDWRRGQDGGVGRP